MKKTILCLLILSFLSLAACTNSETADGGNTISVYRVYREEYRTGGELVYPEKIPYADNADIILSAAYALKSVPEDASLMAALPSSVDIVSADLSGRTVDICLGGAYADLAGMEKTIADSCIALTMCSIPGVDHVSIRTKNGPAGNLISSSDVLLTNTEKSPAEAQIRLFFPREGSNVLSAEYRAVNISEDSTNERIITDQLLKGPESDGLYSAIPADTVVLSVYTQDGVCTVNLSEEFLQILEQSPGSTRLTIYSIVNSLTCLADVESVLISVQGSESSMLGNVDISQPLTSRTSLIGPTVID